MKLSEFMTCWRECVPIEFPIDLEQLKVNYLNMNRFFLVEIILGICYYFGRYYFLY